MKAWLRGGRVVDPTRAINAIEDLFLDGGQIVTPPTDPSLDWTVIDCSGKVIAPGFIDLYADLPDVVTEGRAAAAGGFTCVVSTPTPETDAPAVARDRIRQATLSPVTVLVSGALTRRLQGRELAEMGSLLEAGCRVLSQGIQPLGDTRVLRNALDYAARFGAPVLLRARALLLFARGFACSSVRLLSCYIALVPSRSRAARSRALVLVALSSLG